MLFFAKEIFFLVLLFDLCLDIRPNIFGFRFNYLMKTEWLFAHMAWNVLLRYVIYGLLQDAHAFLFFIVVFWNTKQGIGLKQGIKHSATSHFKYPVTITSTQIST